MFNLNSVENGFSLITCYDRFVDVSPCSNVDCCDFVSGSSETTLDTLKQPSVWTISLLIHSAHWADMACSPRRHSNNGYSFEFCFVFDEASELVESPRRKATTLSFSYRYSLPNTLKVFKGDSSLSVKSFSHQLLGDHMVYVFAESCFFSREPFEVTLRTSTSAFL